MDTVSLLNPASPAILEGIVILHHMRIRLSEATSQKGSTELTLMKSDDSRSHPTVPISLVSESVTHPVGFKSRLIEENYLVQQHPLHVQVRGLVQSHSFCISRQLLPPR